MSGRSPIIYAIRIRVNRRWPINLPASESMPEIPVGAQIFDVVFHPTFSTVYTGLLTGYIKTFSYDDQGNHKPVFSVRPSKSSCRGLSLDQDGSHLYAVGKDVIPFPYTQLKPVCSSAPSILLPRALINGVELMSQFPTFYIGFVFCDIFSA